MLILEICLSIINNMEDNIVAEGLGEAKAKKQQQSTGRQYTKFVTIAI